MMPTARPVLNRGSTGARAQRQAPAWTRQRAAHVAAFLPKHKRGAARVGTTFPPERLSLDKQIGSGAYGEVFLVRGRRGSPP